MKEANKYKEHLVVIPEDRANERMVNGFIMHFKVNDRALTILQPHKKDKNKGGWVRVVKRFDRPLQNKKIRKKNDKFCDRIIT